MTLGFHIILTYVESGYQFNLDSIVHVNDDDIVLNLRHGYLHHFWTYCMHPCWTEWTEPAGPAGESVAW